MEGGKVTDVDLSIGGKTCLAAFLSTPVYASVTNSLFTITDSDVQMSNWECDIECMTATQTILYLGDVDGKVWEWTNNVKKEVVKLETSVIDLDAVGDCLAAAIEDPSPVLYKEGKTRKLQPPHKGNVMSVSLSPDGRFLASIGFDGRLCVYSTNTCERLLQNRISKKRHEDAQEKLKAAWSEDGTRLFVPGDLTLRVVKVVDWLLVDSNLKAESQIVMLKGTGMKDVIAGTSVGRMVFLWNVLLETKLREVESMENVSDLLITKTDIVFSTFDGKVHFWKQENPVLDLVPQSPAALSSDPESEETNYFAQCIGTLPQGPISTLSNDDEDGKSLFKGLLGSIRAKQEKDDIPIIEIQLILEKTEKSMKFSNGFGFDIAYMNEIGAFFANKTGKLLFKSFASEKQQWMVQMPSEEKAELVSVGKTWCCVYSSNLMLRVFSVRGGVQLCALSISGRVIALSSFEDVLGTVYLQSVPTLSVQRLTLETWGLSALKTSSDLVRTQTDLPISPEETLVWFGFSTSGIPCSSDSAGVTRLYWKRADLWVPILHVSNFTILGITDKEVVGVDEESGEIETKTFNVQFCKTNSGEKEAELFLSKLTFDNEGDDSKSHFPILDRKTIDLIREAAVNGEEEKVWAYLDLLKLKKSKEIAVQLLMKLGLYTLSQQINDKLLNVSQVAIPASKTNAPVSQKSELKPRSLVVDRPPLEETNPVNPFQKQQVESKSDIFASLSSVTKRKAEEPSLPLKKRKVHN